MEAVTEDMTMAQATDDFNASSSQAEQILAEIRQLRQDVEQVSQDVEQANQNTNAFNQKFDNYQKATQWVVQLAFSLIAAATVTVIVSTVLGK
jgi:outer membrane murein-binding lipoprotein Lpp